MFVSKDSTVSLCARLALSVPAGMPLKLRESTTLLTEVVAITGLPAGLASGSSRAVNHTDSLLSSPWPIMVLALHLRCQKKQTTLNFKSIVLLEI